MKTYIFTFNVIPTDNSWWSAYRNETIRVHAANLNEAKEAFYNELAERFDLNVSTHAKKTANKMYRDTPDGGVVQVGIVVKAKTEIEGNGKWISKFADVWAEINELVSPFKE